MQALTAGPRIGLDPETVTAAILNPSPHVRHGVTVLDSTLTETGETIPVDLERGGEVAWSYRPLAGASSEATTEVRRQARLSLAGDVDDALLLSRLLRLWTELQAPSGEWVRFNLITGLSALPRRDDDGRVVRRELQVLPREHLWRTRRLDDYVTVGAADDVLQVVRDTLASVFGITTTAFPEPSGSSVLGSAMTFDTDTTYYEFFSRLLAGIAYDQPITTVDGTPTAQPLEVLAGKGSEYVYAPGEGRVVVAGSLEPLDPELPNVVRFVARQGPSLPVEGNGYVTVRNDNTGPASIQQRGFEVFRAVSVDASSQPELESYAAQERQRLFAGGGLRFQGQVGLNPLHDDRDRVTLTRPRLGLSGLWDVTGWSYPLRMIEGGQAVLMSLTAEAVVA